ncbi:MAG: chitobiase/beta-hexosaminidase C-terminal domain-containing protein [Candidatus Moduliflexus flocculans]|nr:chitobiase/beta-hexosaminidase C-terminal domain-containing protein [Candidatus Moduliflexus flocculans]
MTYDRAVLKLDPARFATLNRGFTTAPLPRPTRRISSGPYYIVELAARPGATIRYTLDGSEPVPGSVLYEKPIEITGETTVRARAFWPDGTAELGREPDVQTSGARCAGRGPSRPAGRPSLRLLSKGRFDDAARLPAP